MATETKLYFNKKFETASGPASIANTFTAPAITYSAPNYLMTLSPMKYGAVEYYDNLFTPASTPAAFFSKNGSIGASDMIEITADATNINAAIAGGTANVHALLCHVVSGATTYYITVYVTETNYATLLTTIAALSTWTTDAIIEGVFTPNVTPPGNYTYVVGALAVYTLLHFGLETSPAAAVYLDGDLQTVTTDYTLDVGSDPFYAFVKFVTPPASTSVITCSYTWLYNCLSGEDCEAYEFDKEPSVSVRKDCNGQTLVSEGYNKFGNFRGRLVWPYPTYAFWEMMREIAENPAGTFDIQRVSLAGYEVDRINNLYPIAYTKWEEEPGVVNVVKSLTMEVVEVG